MNNNQVYFLAAFLYLSLVTSVNPLAFADLGNPGGKRDLVELPQGAPEVTLRIPFLADRFSNTPVAMIDDEVITMGELREEVEQIHSAPDESSQPEQMNYRTILERIVSSRLIIAEAVNMGLADLPEVRGQVGARGRSILRKLVVGRHLESLALTPPETEVEEVFRSKVREVRVNSILVAAEDDANSVVDALAAGEDFLAVSRRMRDAGLGQVFEEAEYLKLTDLAPPVAQVLIGMEVGDVSPVVRLGSSFTLLYLADERFPEDAEARASSHMEVRKRVAREETQAYIGTLRSKHLHEDKDLIESLDFEGEGPGLERYLDDARPLVTVVDSEPITIGDLAKKLQRTFYHGTAAAAKEGRLNSKKQATLDEMIEKKALHMEALHQGLDRSKEYLRQLARFEEALLFDLFVKKAIIPDIKISREEVEEHYEANKNEHMSPGMVKIRGLAFHEADFARKTVDKLKEGTDFKWLSANTEGQVGKDEEGVLVFDGGVLSLNGLSKSLQERLKDVRDGEAILFTDENGISYALEVLKYFPPEPAKFESVSNEIFNKIFNRKIGEEIVRWNQELKNHYVVKVFVL